MHHPRKITGICAPYAGITECMSTLKAKTAFCKSKTEHKEDQLVQAYIPRAGER